MLFHARLKTYWYCEILTELLLVNIWQSFDFYVIKQAFYTFGIFGSRFPPYLRQKGRKEKLDSYRRNRMLTDISLKIVKIFK